MRVLVDARHLNCPQPSGVGEYTTRLLSSLWQIDPDNQYYLLTVGLKKPNLSSLTAGQANVTHLHRFIPNKIINSAIAFSQEPDLEEIAKQASDLIFLPNLNFVAPPPNRPTILTVHDLSFHHFPEFYSHKMQFWHKLVRPKQLMARANHIICPSHSTKQDIVSAYQKPETQISVIQHGRHPDFHPVADARDQIQLAKYKLPKQFALYLGTLEPRKNIPTLLQGLREYRSLTNHDLHLVMAGHQGWKSKNIRQAIQEPQNRDWIHYLDYLPANDRPALMRQTAVFLWPSIYEGFGLPVLEAMASGIPVITSHTSSLPEITADSAILIDPYNSRDLARALCELHSSPSLGQKMKKHGLKQAQNFSWTTSAKQTLSLFEKYT